MIGMLVLLELPGTTNLEACEPLMRAVDAFAGRRLLCNLCCSFNLSRGLLASPSNPGFQLFFQRMAPIFRKMRFVLMILYYQSGCGNSS